LVESAEGLWNFKSAGMGREGYYFPQFDADIHVRNRPTDENMLYKKPEWVALQFNNFKADDFIKIQFNSGYSDSPAGFGGLMFDIP